MSDKLRVLLVEDEALILMQLEMLLEDAGHDIVGTAATAAEGIALATEQRPDLAFIDLRLADGSSGLEVARALRGLGETTTVFLTANPGQLPEDFAGAAAVIGKPFTGSVLDGMLAYLEEALRRPPPALDLPHGMLLAPAYRTRWTR